MNKKCFLLLACFMLTSCTKTILTPVVPTPTDTVSTISTSATPSITPSIIVVSSTQEAPVIKDDRDPSDWKNWPIVPDSLSEAMKETYKKGIEAGYNVHAFSKIGDCQNSLPFFLQGFDEPDKYDLGDFSNLQTTIDWYSGQFKRESAAARGGLNVTGVQTMIWTKSTADAVCSTKETPLACELRTNNPSIVLVSFEELWNGDYAKYEKSYRSLINILLQNNVVPILATTATNENANAVIAKLAVEYQLPVWNLWKGLQSLNSKGVLKDNFHLTRWGNIYSFSEKPSGWHIRNTTALQSLDAVRQMLK